MAKFKVAVNAAKKIDVTDLKSGEKKTLDIGELKMHLYGLGKELSDFELALLGDGSLVHARSKTHDYRVVNATEEAEIPASPASNPTVANAMRALANSSCGADDAPVAANSGKCYIEKQNGDWFYIGADNGKAVKEGPFRTRGEAEMAAVSDGLTVANSTACNASDPKISQLASLSAQALAAAKKARAFADSIVPYWEKKCDDAVDVKTKNQIASEFNSAIAPLLDLDRINDGKTAGFHFQ